MGLVFEWDANKAGKNIEKHDVSFEEATTVFGDNRSITISSPMSSINEKRWATMGITTGKRVLVVVHTERGEKI